MSDPGQPGHPGPSDARGGDVAGVIAALREQGGAQVAGIRFHFLEALAKRAAAQPEPVRRVLEARLATALAECRDRFGRAQAEARDTVVRLAERFPESGDLMRGLFDQGDFPGLGRHAAELERRAEAAPLADLLTYARQQASRDLDGDGPESGDPEELKALRHFRNTWSKLSVDQAVTRALAAGPSNAGPLNSHALVLQSLQLMREVSPDYLGRFMAYAEALLWLDQANGSGTPAKKPAGRGETRRKRK